MCAKHFHYSYLSIHNYNVAMLGPNSEATFEVNSRFSKFELLAAMHIRQLPFWLGSWTYSHDVHVRSK